MKKITLLAIIAIAALFTSCNDNNVSYTQINKVFVLNQGNYSSQNGSVYVYDEDTKTLVPNAFEAANSGTSLGAVLMSGTFSSAGIGYLLCSNPDKIEVVDILTMKSISKSIRDELSNVREIAIGGGYIFVTNCGQEYTELPDGSWEYTHSYVSIYNMNNNAFLKKIEVGSDAQGMVYANGVLYVATKQGIVTITNEGGSFSKQGEVYQDKEYTGSVRYLCLNRNTLYASVPGFGVFAYDVQDQRTTKRYEMPLDRDGYLTIDANGNLYTYATIYNSSWAVESSDIYQLDPSGSGSYKKLVSGEYLYSVGVSPYSGNIFTSEANGFTTNSTMNIIDPATFMLVDTKTTGVGTFRYLFCSYLTYSADEK